MPVTGCNYKYNIMPGLALSLYEVVREFSLRLSTIMSVSVTRYKRELVSVSSYNRDLESHSSYKRQIGQLSGVLSGDLSGDLRLGSTAKDDLMYLYYFYLMHPLHVSKFRQLFQSYLSGPLQELKEDISSLNDSFSKLNSTFGIINEDAEALAKSVSRIKDEHLPEVTQKLVEIILKIGQTFTSTNQESKDEVQQETKKNEEKIDTTVCTVERKITDVIYSLRKDIDQRLKEFNSQLQKQKSRLSALKVGLEVSYNIDGIKSNLSPIPNTVSSLKILIKRIYHTFRCKDSSEIGIVKNRLQRYGKVDFEKITMKQLMKIFKMFEQNLRQQAINKLNEELKVIFKEDHSYTNIYEIKNDVKDIVRVYFSNRQNDHSEILRELQQLEQTTFSRENKDIEGFLTAYRDEQTICIIEKALEKVTEISLKEEQVKQIKGKINSISTDLDNLKQEATTNFPDLSTVKHSSLGSLGAKIQQIQEYSQELQTGYIEKFNETKDDLNKITEELQKLDEIEKIRKDPKKSPVYNRFPRNITSGIDTLIVFKFSINNYKSKVEREITRLVEGITGVREAIQSIKADLVAEKPTLDEINYKATQLEGHKKKLGDARSDLKNGKDGGKLSGFKSYVEELIKDGPEIKNITIKPKTTQPTQGGTQQAEQTCPHSQESSSAGGTGSPSGQSNKNVGQELEAVEKELGKLELYRKIILTLKGIEGKLVQHNIETYKEKDSNGITSEIQKLEELEQKILEAEKVSLTTGVGGVASPAKEPLSTKLKANEDLKSKLRGDKSEVDKFKIELDRQTRDLGDHASKTSEKSEQIKAFEEPMEKINSSVTNVNNKTNDTIHKFPPLKDNMHKVKSEREKIDRHRDKVKKLQKLDLPKYTTEVVDFLNKVKSKLDDIDQYLEKNVKKNVNGSVKPVNGQDTITIEPDKTKVEDEIDKIKGNSSELTAKDGDIKAQSKAYLEKFNTFNKSVSKIEDPIESVVRDFIGCSLESLGDSLSNLLMEKHEIARTKSNILGVATHTNQHNSESTVQTKSLGESCDQTVRQSHDLYSYIVLSELYDPIMGMYEYIRPNDTIINETILTTYIYALV